MNQNVSHHFPQLGEGVFVSPQIQLSDIEKITQNAIKTVICHRPEHELSPSEPNFVTLQAELTKNGINMIYQPIQQILMAEVEQLNKRLTDSEAPVLMYCRSGTRSALLWALSETVIKQRNRTAVITAAETAGYALSEYLPSQ